LRTHHRGGHGSGGQRGFRFALAVALSTFAAACSEVEEFTESLFDNRTARERYQESLQLAGLTSTALARDWLTAAERALLEAPAVRSPHAEQGYLAPEQPAALAFRVAARRGQEIAFDVELPGDSAALVFVDAWQIQADTAVPFRHIESADSGVRSLRFEARRDAEFVLRAQPELLRGGRFQIKVSVGPTLAFPVSGARDTDIGSSFGDPRDGGIRDHHGIDIFARRGTPVIAAAEAVVSRVQVTSRGGKVVWLRDQRGNSLYYAHLDSQMVAQGERVETGDTLGLVGNTGNAITTPPHLHFGVYRRGEGPVNPYWFVYRPRGSLPRLAADTSMLGDWARTQREGIVLRTAPDAEADSIATLPLHTALRVVSAVGTWYRVQLPDGSGGYLTSRFAEAAEQAVRTASPAAGMPVFASPAATAGVVTEVEAGNELPVLGRFGDYLLVRAPGGRAGWLAQEPGSE
jgi:murein DD-endopeptidase MepM/ murein hydrolase activator NlpD